MKFRFLGSVKSIFSVALFPDIEEITNRNGSIQVLKHIKGRPFGNLRIGILALALASASTSVFEYKYSLLHSINHL